MGSPVPANGNGKLQFVGKLTLDKDIVDTIFDDPRESIADAFALLGKESHAKDIAELTGFAESMIQDIMERGDFMSFLERRVAEKSLDALRLREKVSGKIHDCMQRLESPTNLKILDGMTPTDLVKFMIDLAKLERYRASTEEILIHNREPDSNGQPTRMSSPRQALQSILQSKVGRAFLARREGEKKEDQCH